MQKADAEKMLLQCASGTFLIRFSEGEPGGISVAWVTGELTRLYTTEGNTGIKLLYLKSASMALDGFTP